jgi:RNA polymerase sigma factor (sigma-70 family)
VSNIIPTKDYKYIKRLAYKLYLKSNYYITLEDLIQVGVITYLEKRATYDATVNDKMMGYAYLRINGAMKDYIAKNSPKGFSTVRPNSYKKRHNYETHNFSSLEIDEEGLESNAFLSPEEFCIREEIIDRFNDYYKNLSVLEQSLLLGFFKEQRTKTELSKQYNVTRYKTNKIIENCLKYLRKFLQE